MTTERSTTDSHHDYPDQKAYDLNYHSKILELVKGVVLDLGCGTGLLSQKMANLSQVERVYAYDKFPAWEREAKTTPKLINRESDFTNGYLPPFEEKFDTIVSTEFIEHISQQDLELLLPKLSNLLNKDGIFVGTTPIKVVPTTNRFHLKEYEFGEFVPLFDKYFKTEVKDIGYGCQLWIAYPL